MILWYDNEWGYSSKVIDLIKSIFLNKDDLRSYSSKT